MPLALRSPSFLPDYLFEAQWMWWIAILGFAAACIYVGKGRGRKAIVNTGVAIAALTILWMLAAAIFETNRTNSRRAPFSKRARGRASTRVKRWRL